MHRYNTDLWTWNTHGGDWIFPEGPDSSSNLHDPYFNQWNSLDDSAHGWEHNGETDPSGTDPWLDAIGRSIY